MDMVRSMMLMQSNQKKVFEGINQELAKINTYQLKFSFSPIRRSIVSERYDYFKKLRQMIYEKCTNKNFIKELLEIPKNLSKKIRQIVYYSKEYLPHISEKRWLLCIGVSPAGCQQFGEKKMLKANYLDFILLNHYVYFCHQQQSICQIPLTIDWYMNQYRTLKNQFECHSSLPLNAGKYFVCPSCKKIKGFIVQGQNQKKIYYASGHEKIAYDIENNKVYCAHKNIKLRNKRKNKRNKQISREIRRKHEVNSCRDTECIPVSLLGNLLQIFGKCYVLCPIPFCGRLCVFEFWKHGKGGFHCGYCQKPNTKHERCFYCNKKLKKSSTPLQLEGKKGDLFLCRDHDHPNLHLTCSKWTQTNLFKQIDLNQRKKYS